MEKIKPYLPSLLLVWLCITIPGCPFGDGQPWYGPLLYHFAHANVWHALGNFAVLARFRPRWENVPVAYLSASAAAYLVFLGPCTPTVGMSGMIFAMFARRDAIFGEINWRLMLIIIATGFIPAFNWRVHFMSYAISFIIWIIIQNNRNQTPRLAL